MKLSDIIALAKAGYKPSEVKELLEMAEPEPKEEPKEPKEPEEPEEKKDPKEPEEPKEPSKEPDEPDKTDYKALYEETEKKLKEVQKENRNKDSSPEIKSDEDIALNYINSIFK